MGVGLISIPYSFSRMGIFLSIIMLIFMVLLCQFTIALYLKCKNLSRHSNFTTIIYHIYEHKLIKIVPSAAIIGVGTGACIGQIIILKQGIRKIVENFVDPQSDALSQFYLSPSFFAIVIGLLQIPLVIVKKIEKLRYMAFFGVIGIIVFLISFLIHFFQSVEGNKWCRNDVVFANHDLFEIASVLPNFIFALGIHPNIFPTYKGIEKTNDRKMKMASLSGMIGAIVICSIFGSTAYCLTGHDAKGNFLLNFLKQDIGTSLYIILNISFMIAVFMSLPLYCP